VRWLAALAGVAVAALSLTSAEPVAFARPTIWERTERPALNRTDRAWRRISRYMDSVEDAQNPEMRHDFWLGALLMAEESGAAVLPDPGLRLLLAQILLGTELGREAEAASLAHGVLAEAGPDDLWLEAEARVVLAFAAKDPELAIREVARALPLVWDASTRSDLFRRRADAKMAERDLRGSLADYRAALQADDSARRTSLARFGIGLALERSGNLPEALVELHRARLAAPRVFGGELSVLLLPGVFAFRPADVYYVVGLTELSRIPNPADPDGEAAACERAHADFREFRSQAPLGDPWLERAERYVNELPARCQKLLARPPSGGAN
jgi:hypothetical protein